MLYFFYFFIIYFVGSFPYPNFYYRATIFCNINQSVFLSSGFTVTLQVAVLPLNRVIFIFAVPVPTAFITALLPLPFCTVATLVFVLVHFRFAPFA